MPVSTIAGLGSVPPHRAYPVLLIVAQLHLDATGFYFSHCQFKEIATKQKPNYTRSLVIHLLRTLDMFPFSQEMRSDQAALISPASREEGGLSRVGSIPTEALEEASAKLQGEWDTLGRQIPYHSLLPP